MLRTRQGEEPDRNPGRTAGQERPIPSMHDVPCTSSPFALKLERRGGDDSRRRGGQQGVPLVELSEQANFLRSGLVQGFRGAKMARMRTAGRGLHNGGLVLSFDHSFSFPVFK